MLLKQNLTHSLLHMRIIILLMTVRGISMDSILVTCKFTAMDKGSFHPDRKFALGGGSYWDITIIIPNTAEIIYIGAYNYIKIIS